MFKLSAVNDGMSAYVRLQEEEFADVNKSYTLYPINRVELAILMQSMNAFRVVKALQPLKVYRGRSIQLNSVIDLRLKLENWSRSPIGFFYKLNFL